VVQLAPLPGITPVLVTLPPPQLPSLMVGVPPGQVIVANAVVLSWEIVPTVVPELFYYNHAAQFAPCSRLNLDPLT
jgi:hypothetical protein